MKCAHCPVTVQELKSVEGPSEWVHVEDGVLPYWFCRLSVAEPNTVGAWAARLLDATK